VLNHHEGSATGGYYTLDVLYPDPRDKGRVGWIRIGDEFMQNIQVEDLLVRDVGDDRSISTLLQKSIPARALGGCRVIDVGPIDNIMV